jgi:hypothetical protein
MLTLFPISFSPVPVLVQARTTRFDGAKFVALTVGHAAMAETLLRCRAKL